ncbi:MAG: hypothetical protein CSH37_14775 [Thalassolituus sp.]|nr:MAG: hypothetical protein CSH37_14775 [Thalassolituus sp.]
MKRYWVGLLLLAYGSLLVVLSVSKSAEFLLEYLYQLEDYFGGDKQMHLKLAAMLSILGCFAAERVLDLARLKRVVLVVSLASVFLTIDEGIQYVLDSRRFEFEDLAYGIAGLVLGCLGYLIFDAAKGAVRRLLSGRAVDKRS